MESTHCTTPGEALSALVELIGGLPRDSLVLLPMSGTRGEGVLRIDLPRRGPGGTDSESWAHAVLSLLLCRPGADGMLGLICVDEPAQPAGRVPRAALARILHETAHRAGLHCVLLMWITRESWGRYPGPAEPAQTPRPREGLRGAARNASFRPPLRLEPEPEPDPVRAGTVRAVCAAEAGRDPGAGEAFAAWRAELDAAHVHRMGDARSRGADSPTRGPASPESAGLLLHLLRVGGGPRLVTDALFGRLGTLEWPEAIAWALGRRRPSRPPAWSAARARAASLLLREAHDACGSGERPTIALWTAWLEWGRGGGSAAALWAARCLKRSDDGQERRQAGVVNRLAEQGIVAPWLHQPPQLDSRAGS
ncbi:MAG: hypothetical protein Q4E05_07630 [Pseudoclavibacter sp.]|nr:hypothetical protein [Pseudoclavibacter sp.]